MRHTAVNQESPSWGTPSSCWKISFSYQEVIGKLITWNTSPKPNYLGCCDPLVLQSWWSFGFSSPKRHLLRSGQALSQSAKNKNTDFQGPFLIKTIQNHSNPTISKWNILDISGLYPCNLSFWFQTNSNQKGFKITQQTASHHTTETFFSVLFRLIWRLTVDILQEF